MAENPSRINFYEKYQEIIQAYNQEQNRATIEKTFEELMHLSQSLSEEEKRYVREGFKSDEELSLYDLLLKDNLSKTEVKKLKDVAIELLAKIKEQLAGMDHPFDKPTTRATLIITIREELMMNWIWIGVVGAFSLHLLIHCAQAIALRANDLDDITFACIGPITARTCQEAGLKKIVTAQTYTIAGLAECITDWRIKQS